MRFANDLTHNSWRYNILSSLRGESEYFSITNYEIDIFSTWVNLNTFLHCLYESIQRNRIQDSNTTRAMATFFHKFSNILFLIHMNTISVCIYFEHTVSACYLTSWHEEWIANIRIFSYWKYEKTPYSPQPGAPVYKLLKHEGLHHLPYIFVIRSKPEIIKTKIQICLFHLKYCIEDVDCNKFDDWSSKILNVTTCNKFYYQILRRNRAI